MSNTPEKTDPATTITLLSQITCGLAMIICVATAAIVYYRTRVFINVYEDFDTDVPTLTLFILGWYVPLTICTLTILAVVIVKEFVLTKHHGASLIINVVVAMLVSLALCTYSIAMIMPFWSPVFTVD